MGTKPAKPAASGHAKSGKTLPRYVGGATTEPMVAHRPERLQDLRIPQVESRVGMSPAADPPPRFRVLTLMRHAGIERGELGTDAGSHQVR